MGEKSWKIQVVNIKAKKSSRSLQPFQPPILSESEPIIASDVLTVPLVESYDMPLHPLSLTVGHVLVRTARRLGNKINDVVKVSSSSATTTEGGGDDKKSPEITERSRHFFCGEDWNHAAQQCSAPCPSGMKTECPNGWRCYADTPCDYYTYQSNKQSDMTQKEDIVNTTFLLADYNNVTRDFYLSPRGGLPSVMTLWSNGVVTMHSLTAAKTKTSSTSKAGGFTVTLMWRTNIIANPEKRHVVDWTDWKISFIDPVLSGRETGLVMVSAILETIPRDFEDGAELDTYTKVVVALNAATGEIVWRTFLNDELPENIPKAPLLQPMERGTTSSARRRSLIPNVHKQDDTIESSVNAIFGESQHCLLSSFRRSLLLPATPGGSSVLPHRYWAEDDASIQVIHFELERKQDRSLGDGKKKQSAKRPINHNTHPISGRPNVLVTHDQEGISVRSLKNGRALCHLGLAEGIVYADINHDGTLDSVQIAIGTHTVEDRAQEEGLIDRDADDDLRFISELAQRVAKEQKKNKIEDSHSSDSVDGNSEPDGSDTNEANLCHLFALSGIPSREELFSIDICGGASKSASERISVAPPLLVERGERRRKGWDIVVATNSGLIHRISGGLGRRQWRLKGRHKAEGADNAVPTWDDPTLAILDRIDSRGILPQNRPVVLAGEDAMSFLSVSSGKVLASVAYPQPSIRRPILVDFDGDGTTDLLVQTKDAIWGFKVIVVTGSSLLLRILVGLLLLSILVALLRNKFGPHPGKRSTDL